MVERKKLIIDRNTWLRGEGCDDSYLLRTRDNRMCCLGFASKQLAGLDDESIEDVTSPDELNMDEVTAALPWLFDQNGCEGLSNDCLNLMKINDSWTEKDFTEKDREEQIKAKFAEHDIDVEFVN